MPYKYFIPLIAATALSLGLASAHAGPCIAKIKQFERAVRNSKPGPSTGPGLAPINWGATEPSTDARVSEAGRTACPSRIRGGIGTR